MQTKICLRSGQCCSGLLALVPKYETSDLSDRHLDTLDFDDQMSYIEENSEPMGKPCKWLERDSETTEATCKAHKRKSSMCINYPEHLAGSPYCPSGVAYWSERKANGLKVPDWVMEILLTLGK